MKKFLKSVLVLVCLVVMPIAGYAATSNNQFSFVLDTGSLNFNQTKNQLYGADITVKSLTTIVDGQTSVYTLESGKLSFGADYSIDPIEGLKIGSGGYMEILGNVYDGANLIAGGKLLSATGFNKNVFSWSTLTAIQSFSISSGPATLSKELDSLLNMNDSQVYKGTSLLVNFTAPTTFDVSFTGVPLKDGSVAGGAPPVPIPAAAWLFLSGFAGLAGLRRKNKK